MQFFNIWDEPQANKKIFKKTKQNKYWPSNGQSSPNDKIFFTPSLIFYLNLTIIWYVVYQTFPQPFSKTK